MFILLCVDDLPQLLVIERATQLFPWCSDAFERCFLMGCCGWGIEKEGQLIGFILVQIQVSECHILNIGILPGSQRQGYGSQLLKHALIEAQQQGAIIAYLEVRKSNKSAIALYTKIGFKKIGERKAYYSFAEGQGREDACVLAKNLGK